MSNKSCHQEAATRSAAQSSEKTEADSLRLTGRQRAFVDAYIEHRNAAEAARRAGYSERSANRQGSRLLRHPAVAREIEALEEEARTIAVANRTELLMRLTEVVRFRWSAVLDEKGELGDGALRRALASGAVREVRLNSEGKVESIKTHDLLRAIELICRMEGHFEKEAIENMPPIQLINLPPWRGQDGVQQSAEEDAET